MTKFKLFNFFHLKQERQKVKKLKVVIEFVIKNQSIDQHYTKGKKAKKNIFQDTGSKVCVNKNNFFKFILYLNKLLSRNINQN